MKAVIRPRNPIYLIVKPCGCVSGYIVMDAGVLPHHLICEERRRGNHVIESDLMFPPKLKDCPHKTQGVQAALPGLEPLVSKRKAK